MPDVQTAEAIEKAKEKMKGMEEARNGGTTPPSSTPKSKDDLIHPTSGKPKKKSFGTKLKEAFFGENVGDGSITENIFFRIFIPKLKMVLSEMANSAINSALGLDNRTRTFNGGYGYNVHQSNAANYRDRNYSRVSPVGNARRGAISEEVWDGPTVTDIYSQMQDIIEQFPEEGLTVADVYSIMGLKERILSTDRGWGWRSMNGINLVCIDQTKDLWIIDMPPARQLY